MKNIKFGKVAIIGVGLIGGSLAKAFRRKRLAREVVGFFRKRKKANKARSLRIVDKASFSLKTAASCADLIILAMPVGVIKRNLAKIIGYAKPGAILMDVGSTKKQIIDLFTKLKPKKDISFVGAHPLAGSDKSGLVFAKADMFKGSICFLVPSKITNNKALIKIKKIWQALGSQVIVIDGAMHDRIVASTSHLPHMISFALMNSLSHKLLPFCGSGLKDCTRLALSSDEIWCDICLSNDKAILHAIDRFKRSLSFLEILILRRQARLLKQYFQKAKDRRVNL